MVSLKEKRKAWENKLTNEINNLPGKQFKALVIRILMEFGKRIEHSENIDKKLENMKKN